MSRRVGITGQFPIDFAIIAGRSPYKIARNPMSVQTDRVPSWNKFCDDVDAALAPVTRSKALLWPICCAVFGVGVLAIVGLIVTSYATDISVPFFVIFPIAVAPVLTQTAFGCRHNSVLRTAMNQGVKGACAQHSGDGVTYALKEEDMPGRGFNRSMLSFGERQYYIMVEVDAEQGAGEPAASPAPQGEPTKALQDMLNEPLIAGK